MRRSLIVCTLLAALLIYGCGDIDTNNTQMIETFITKVMNSDTSACDMMIHMDKRLCLDRMKKEKPLREQQAKELGSYAIKALKLDFGDEKLQTYKGQLLIKLKNGEIAATPINVTIRNIDGIWKIQDK